MYYFDFYLFHNVCEDNINIFTDQNLGIIDYLKEQNIKTWIRQVIIPTFTDGEENILKLKEIISNYPNIEKTELLPFRKLCQTKYDNMKIEFPLKDVSEPSKETMDNLKELIKKA